MSDEATEGPRIAAILGTARPGNYTSRALALVIDEIHKIGRFPVRVIDPSTMDLPLPGSDSGSAQMRSLRETVSDATGLIFATPEYHGTYSAVTKLIIENLGFPSVLASKPVALLGVAAGQIGAIKALEHLRPHSASYALVSFKSAFLKVHHPAEFMAAVLSNGGGYYSTFAYISECRRMGLELRLPDINESGRAYIGRSVVDNGSSGRNPGAAKTESCGWVRVGLRQTK